MRLFLTITFSNRKMPLKIFKLCMACSPCNIISSLAFTILIMWGENFSTNTKKKSDKNSFIYHLSSNYSKNPAGLFGTFKVKYLLEKNLVKFITPTYLEKSINKTLFYLYSLFRINFNNLKRKII